MATDARVSQVPVEIAVSSTPNPPARISQVPVEIAVSATPNPPARISQVVVEIAVKRFSDSTFPAAIVAA